MSIIFNQHAAITLATVALALVSAACGTVITRPPEPPRPPEVCQGDECEQPKPTAAAIDAFEDAVATYQRAKADGALSGAECERSAAAFTEVYKQHGASVAIARFNAGAVYEECGELDKAAAIYQELITTVPDFGLAYNNLGVIEWDKGKERSARDLFRASVEKNRLQALAARNNVAGIARDAYVRTSDRQSFEEAERAIQQVLALDSSNQLAYENLARLYFDRGRLQDPSYTVLANLVVQQGLRVIGEQGRESAELMNVKGLLLLGRDDQVAALKAFERAAELDPSHVEANLNIAFIAVRFRDYDRAARGFEIAFKDPAQRENVDAQIGYGVALRGQKKFAAAEKAYRAAAKLDPSDPRPIYNLGVLNQDHVASAGDVTNEKTIKYFTIARDHFQHFLQKAGAREDYKTGVLEAKDRIAAIDETIDNIHEAEKLIAKVKQLEAEAAAAEAKERARLKDLERRALEAEKAKAASE